MLGWRSSRDGIVVDGGCVRADSITTEARNLPGRFDFLLDLLELDLLPPFRPLLFLAAPDGGLHLRRDLVDDEFQEHARSRPLATSIGHDHTPLRNADVRLGQNP